MSEREEVRSMGNSVSPRAIRLRDDGRLSLMPPHGGLGKEFLI